MVYVCWCAAPRLHEHLQGDWENTIPKEGSRPLEIMGPHDPVFFHNTELNNEIMAALLPMHEEWSGVKLVPSMT